jgi:hypothetical protein
MPTLNQAERYAKVIEVSKHVRQWARGLNPCTCRGALAVCADRARTTT